MIRILIADDHAIVREGLKQIVAEEKNMKVVGEAGSGDELYQLLKMQEFDVVVLDINMPGKNGLDILKDITEMYKGMPVLILSMYGEEQYGIRAIKAGAAAYLKKESAPEELVKAIKIIVAGKKYITPQLANALALTIDYTHKKKGHENLSDREYEVMCKIAEGKTALEIAGEMSISIHTIYSYRNRILEKLNLKSSVEITQYVLRNRLEG
jgi:Response regulator containing a CheY-like receiver domain and an HTH DNA-binding domain